MPGLDETARDILLLHQFLAGIPDAVSRQLRATGETKTLVTTVERARLLLTINSEHQAAAISEKPSEIELLREQLATLTEQVAALSTLPSSRSAGDREHERPIRPRRCFGCRRPGHLMRECPFRRSGRIDSRRCFRCNQLGHISRDCQSENYQGAFGGGHGRPGRQ